MVIFHSYVELPEGIFCPRNPPGPAFLSNIATYHPPKYTAGHRVVRPTEDGRWDVRSWDFSDLPLCHQWDPVDRENPSIFGGISIRACW